MSKIYVASSWRNDYQPRVVDLLRSEGHEVYDFRYPGPGLSGFHWSEIDTDWREWTPAQYREALQHPIATKAFASDFGAMQWADTCILVLPAGRSASWKLGWSAGAGKDCIVYLPEKIEPELMYGGGGQARIATTEAELLDALAIADRWDRR